MFDATPSYLAPLQSRERTTDPIHSQDCRECNFQSIEPSQAEIIMADADLTRQVLSWGSY